MWMECCRGDWRRAVVMKETRVWLIVRKEGAVHVECLDFVSIGSTRFCQYVLLLLAGKELTL